MAEVYRRALPEFFFSLLLYSCVGNLGQSVWARRLTGRIIVRVKTCREALLDVVSLPCFELKQHAAVFSVIIFRSAVLPPVCITHAGVFRDGL